MAIRPSRQWLKQLAGFVIAVAVLSFVVLRLRSIDWPAVGDAMAAYGWPTLLVAVGIALPAVMACACYDLIGRRVTGHRLSVPRTMIISFTGYFVSLNLGAIVGGLALRYRLYMPYQLKAAVIGQIIGLSILTNWAGFAVIAGISLLIGSHGFVTHFGIPVPLVRSLGALLLMVAAGYLVVCHLMGGRRIRVRQTELELPSVSLAAIQLSIACTNWAFMGAAIAWLLPDIGWLGVMPVLMASAVAGIWSHVPGGLGVTESVFVTLLSEQAEEARILAAVLIFRVIYYLIPLVIAVAAYAYLELTASRTVTTASAPGR